MKYDKIYAEMLSCVCIARVSEPLAKALELREDQKSICVYPSNIDDLVYVGGDEATKKADVELVYAKSFYGGGSCASTKLMGEGIGILAGPDIAQVRAAADAVRDFEASKVLYAVTCNDDDDIFVMSYCVSSVGSYFSKAFGIPKGASMSWLGAPPTESVYAMDAALKASNAQLVQYFGPPTETNWGGAIMTGTQSDCKTACDAWARAVMQVADQHFLM